MINCIKMFVNLYVISSYKNSEISAKFYRSFILIPFYNMWSVYLISTINEKKTYVGTTNDTIKRLQKHNTNKGAKSTKGYEWKYVLTINGFTSRSIACSFESYYKQIRYTRNRSAGNLIKNRIVDLALLFKNGCYDNIDICFADDKYKNTYLSAIKDGY